MNTEEQKTVSHNGDLQSVKPRLADLLDTIDHVIRKHVQLPKPVLGVLIAVWLAQTYCFMCFRSCGYLALRSATPRCGKTTLLRVLSRLAAGTPNIETLPTPAVLFRDGQSVLMLDEVDRLKNADKEKYGEVMAVLNVGFEAGGVVRRCEGKAHTVTKYNVFSPKCMAGVEAVVDTLADRTFQTQMERSPKRMPRLNLRVMDELFAQLRNGLHQWTTDHEPLIVQTYDALPDQLECLQDYDDRFQDVSEPLIVLATLADGQRPEGPKVLPRLLEGLKVAAGRREPSGRERELIAFLEVVEPLLNSEAHTFIPSATLVGLCAEREDLSRMETGRALAGFLRHFDLYPKPQSGKTRGYQITREWVDTWKDRYPKKETA